jgi:hypothetical protein
MVPSYQSARGRCMTAFSFPSAWPAPRARVLWLAWVPQAAEVVEEAVAKREDATVAAEEQRPVMWLEPQSLTLARLALRPRHPALPLFALLPQAAWMQPGGRMGAIRPDAPSSES